MVRKMSHGLNFACLASLLAGLLSSCVISESHQKVLQGSLAISQGDYQGATIRYLEAFGGTGSRQDYIQYNLGNVYHSLGETAAAQNMWNQAAATTDTDLLFAIRFNQGIAWYELGKFDQAVDAFREALILDSGSVETKINLELALQKNSTAVPPPQPPAETAKTGPGQTEADASRLLEYVERKETAPWQSNPKYAAREGVNDW